MPNQSEHKNQVNHNLNILDSNVLSCGQNDWKVTIIFYAAVHLIESFLATKNIHNVSHKDRFTKMGLIAELKRVANDYNVLYMSSLKSRYMCKQFSDKDVAALRAVFMRIQNNIPS